MDHLNLIESSDRRWNRKILNSYWFVVVVSAVVEAVNSLFSEQNITYFLLRYLLAPTVTMAICVLIAGILVRYTRLPNDYVLLITGDILALILTLAHPTVPVTTTVVILPLLISAFYFDPKKVISTAVMGFVTLLGAYEFDPVMHAALDPMDLVTVLAILAGGSYIAIEVMHRGKESLEQLKSSLEKNHELMIQNIVMESASKLDGLTETYNHKSFHQHLGDLIKQCDKLGSSLHLLIYDIDNFKKINDQFGHQNGDLILRRVAQVMKGQVGMHDFVARYGGEEFAVILLEKTDEQASSIANGIRQAVAALHHEEIGGPVTVSGGLAAYVPGKGKDWLFNQSDDLLYLAKHNGKNQIAVALNE